MVRGTVIALDRPQDGTERGRVKSKDTIEGGRSILEELTYKGAVASLQKWLQQRVKALLHELYHN